ncbi:NAD-dependent epimerase/dehydratase family protein [Pelagibacterales bacterium SAG-MED05]|nr:NAD-dependent epimerase/dehydratase family protein [Pelagibacterales bacterium SAG-MED05]
MKKGKYLITGSAGFIGSHLVKKISNEYDLILVDDLSKGSLKFIPKKYRKKLIKKKIQDLHKVNIKKLKGIFHLAAQSSVPFSLKNLNESSTNNLSSSIKVFDLAKKYSVPIVYASSSAIYGHLSKGKDSVKRYSITSPYAQDKLTLENYAKMSFDVFKISSVGLRLFNVYGPGQNPNNPYSAVIPIFLNKMKKNISVTINGGYQTRDFIFVDDVIKIMLLSMKKVQNNKKYEIFNVGTNRSVTINYLYSLIKNKLGSKSKFKRRKLDKFDPKKSSGTFKKMNRFLNLKKSFFTKLEDGIQKTIDY